MAEKVKDGTMENHGRGDELVEMDTSSEARRKNPELPKTWQMRAIRYSRRGFPPQILLTSLIDSKAFPAKELVALYHERWELELGYNEVKTTLLEREETIRSQTPAGVAQELWGVALAYNLIRLELERTATLLGGTAHEGHGRNDDYVLRGLLRCGLCGAAMTPASTRKGERQYRYYRCSTRDKVGPESCSAAPLPAGAIEEFVVTRVRKASLDRSLVADVRNALEEKLRHRRSELNVLRRGLPTRIANLSASSSRLADELSRATGRAHEVIQAKLAVEDGADGSGAEEWSGFSAVTAGAARSEKIRQNRTLSGGLDPILCRDYGHLRQPWTGRV